MDRSGQQLGVQRQREDGLALAERKGWTVVEEYCDNDVSASTGRVRPEYQRMLADIRNGALDAVVVWSIDRLTRRTIEIEEFIELCDDHDVALASVGGDVDISTAGGRLHLRIMGAVARDEIDRKADRQRRQRQQAAESGRMVGGRRAFGYTSDGLHLDPAEAPLLAEAYRRFLGGESLGTIARQWNDLARTTPRGHAWRYQSVRNVLANPRNAGLRGVRQLLPGKAGRSGAREKWHTVVGDAVWPAVVDREVWEATMAILKDPRRRAPGRNPWNDERRRYLLSGIAECSECGATLITGRRDGARTLRCPSLAHVSRRAEPLEELVVEVLLARMADPAAAAMLQRREPDIDTTALRLQGETERARRAMITDMLADGEMSRADAQRAYRRIDERLDAIDSELAAATRADHAVEIAGAENPRAVWEQWPTETRRRVLRRFLRVVVHPGKPGRPGGRRFDPSTIEVTWRS